MDVQSELVEQSPGESHTQFLERIEVWFHAAVADARWDTLLACSHGDWIPEWVRYLDHPEVHPGHMDQVVWALGEKHLKLIRFSF